MPRPSTVHTVHKALNKPLTICGAERRLFFLAVIMGGATFNLFGSLVGGILMFAGLLIPARWSTQQDPQMLRILLNASKLRGLYDPMKLEPQSERGRR